MLLVLHSCLHSTRALNALGLSFNLIAMHNLCLVCNKIAYSGNFVLAVASCGITFCSDVCINFYEPIIQWNTHSIRGFDLLERAQIKLQASEQYRSYKAMHALWIFSLSLLPACIIQNIIANTTNFIISFNFGFYIYVRCLCKVLNKFCWTKNFSVMHENNHTLTCFLYLTDACAFLIFLRLLSCGCVRIYAFVCLCQAISWNNQ